MYNQKLPMSLKQFDFLVSEQADHIAEDSIMADFISLNMVGRSLPFVDVLKKIKKIANYDATVLIEGETGTGKEMASRAIHYLSNRHDYPFIPVNCGIIPDNLILNELFGHEKGAYTDAKNPQTGLVAQAEGGTLFLDEIETLSIKGQVTLLRFLQDQRFRPLGSIRPKKANVRIIAATNTNLSALVEQDRFRQDLLYRLNIVSILLPPLRDRSYDIELLAEYFMNKFRKQYKMNDKYLHPNTIDWMRHYGWPGNVRELENTIHREFLLSEGSTIIIKDDNTQPEMNKENLIEMKPNNFSHFTFHEAKNLVADEFEKKYLHWLMTESHGNVTVAAKLAGKERRALGKLLKKHGMRRDSYIHQ